MPKAKIISAVGVAVRSSNKRLGKAIEDAMRQAILDANADGIPVTDSDTIKDRMLSARRRVKEEWGGLDRA